MVKKISKDIKKDLVEAKISTLARISKKE